MTVNQADIIKALEDNWDKLPLAAYEKPTLPSEHPANICAYDKIEQLCDQIKQANNINNPEGVHALNVFLTRLLFCYYAEDTGLFKTNQFTKAIESYTHEDGCDMSSFFTRLFYILNQPDGSSVRNVLQAYYTDFPYVHGSLFSTSEAVPELNGFARKLIIDCGALDWVNINAEIFGPIFQTVLDAEQFKGFTQHTISAVTRKTFDKDSDETATEILGLYEFIESTGQVEELLDFVYDKAKNGDPGDLKTAIRTFDYYTKDNMNEERLRELRSM